MSRSFPAPAGRAPAVTTALLVAVVLLAVAVVAVRDGAVGLGWTGGAELIPKAVDALDGRRLGAFTLLGIGVVLAILGLALIASALRRATPTHRPVGDGTVWVSPRALAAIAATAADRTAGVLETGRPTVRRRRIRVPVTVMPDHDDPASVRTEAEANARAAVAVLDAMPVVVVLEEATA